jgi:hypothetical protein
VGCGVSVWAASWPVSVARGFSRVGCGVAGKCIGVCVGAGV